MCANPKEINRLENGYLISLIQKRIYFGISSKDPAASALRDQIGELYKNQAATLAPDKNANTSNIVDDKLVVTRFLYTMAQSLDVDKKWLDTSFEAEKTFMKALAPALQVPGISLAVNSAMTEAAVSPFNEMKIQGQVSPQLAAVIASGGPETAIAPGRIDASEISEADLPAADGSSAEIPSAGITAPAAPPASGTGAAYERYKAAYRKYVDSLGNPDMPKEQVDRLIEELSVSSGEYQKLSAPAIRQGN